MKQLLLLLFLIQINLFSAQNKLFVSAENGLIVRDDANKSANRIGKFAYAEALEVLEKTDKHLEVTDNGKTIKAVWYKVKGKSVDDVTLSGYVFSGFLTKTPLKEHFEFINYNDDGDYSFLIAKKNDTIHSYYYNDINRSYLRGDIIEILWKKNTIVMAGDEDIKYEVEWIISTKKIKDGNVSMYRKHYKNKLKYIDLSVNYADSYLNKLYLITEFYIANTTGDLIINAIKEKMPLSYVIERRMWNDKEYAVIGISQEFENKKTIIQWLFISQETEKIYEYDLPKDKLIEFK